MDVVSSLRTLWRLRLALVVVALLALLIGISMAYRIQGPTSLVSRQYRVGVATTQALVDTPSSQVADLGSQDAVPVDISTLAARAGLLANLMTTSPMKDEIAVRAGIRPDQLIAVPPASAAPAGAGGAGPSAGVKADPNAPDAHILNVTIPELQSGQIPIIAISTQAPDAPGAARLANGAIAVLEERLQSVANNDRVPAERRVVVRRLGAAQASVAVHGPGKKMAVVVTLLLFLLGCGAILGVVAFARSWRRAAELERTGEERAVAPSSGSGSGGGDVVEDEDVPSWALSARERAVAVEDWTVTGARTARPAAEHRG